MKGKFSIKASSHPVATYKVTGRINGKRITNFFRTRQKRKCIVNDAYRAHQLRARHGSMPSALRAEALACSERLARIGATLTKATDYFLEVHDTKPIGPYNTPGKSAKLIWNAGLPVRRSARRI